MGKKYIVEIGRLERLYKASVNGNGKPNMTWLSPEVDLTPYTEPDLHEVRKKAYEKGYHDAAEEKYNDGLADAWDAARKVTQVREYGGYGDCLEEVFGRHRVPWDVFDYSASECIEKIRQYEQEKDRQARIEYNFDEIKDVLETTANECNVSLDEISEVLQKMKETDNG